MKAGEDDPFKQRTETSKRKTLNGFCLERHERNPHNESTKSPCMTAVHQAKRAMRLDWSQKNEIDRMTHKSDHLGEDLNIWQKVWD